MDKDFIKDVVDEENKSVDFEDLKEFENKVKEMEKKIQQAIDKAIKDKE